MNCNTNANFSVPNKPSLLLLLLLLQLELRLGIVEAVKAAAYLAIKVIYSGQIAPAEHLVDGRDLG